ncbi:MAG: hypothetical protein DRJ42_29840 [Deltaproteobacteria bacterium]|nr:MAG: hypothetical protein DRJ42_29840 [Deltaproteobacteria bacterium]
MVLIALAAGCGSKSVERAPMDGCPSSPDALVEPCVLYPRITVSAPGRVTALFLAGEPHGDHSDGPMLLWSVEDIEGRVVTEAIPLTLDGEPMGEPRWVAPTRAASFGEVGGSNRYLAMVEGGGVRLLDREGTTLDTLGLPIGSVRVGDIVGRGRHVGVTARSSASGETSWHTWDGESEWRSHRLENEVLGVSIADRESSGVDAWILTRGISTGVTRLEALFDTDDAPRVSTLPSPGALTIDNAGIASSTIALGIRSERGPQLAIFSESGLTTPVDVGGEIWQVHAAYTEQHEGMVATVLRADGVDSTWEVHAVIRGDDFDRWHAVLAEGLDSTRAVIVGADPGSGAHPDFFVAWPDATEAGVVIQPIGCSCFASP